MDNPIHILAVEDAAIARKIIKYHMSEQGCIVDTAPDRETALEMVANTQYDLILMDIGLGDGPDGFEVTDQIKKQNNLNNQTPVMAITARGEPEYRDKAIKHGIIGYFNKPFTESEAKKVLEALKKLSE